MALNVDLIDRVNEKLRHASAILDPIARVGDVDLNGNTLEGAARAARLMLADANTAADELWHVARTLANGAEVSHG